MSESDPLGWQHLSVVGEGDEAEPEMSRWRWIALWAVGIGVAAVVVMGLAWWIVSVQDAHTRQWEQQCRDQGGRVITLRSEHTCLVNGVVVGKR